MATTLVVRTDLSGTSFVLDVTALELTTNLSTLDFEVTHNGSVVSNLYAKTSATQLTYTGTNVTLGTKIVARRVTSVVQSETTFLSTTTAAALTNALEKERLRIDELDARLSYTLAQVALGGISIGSIPVLDTAYGLGWNGDNINAPSRNATYDKLASLDTDVANLQHTPFVQAIRTGAQVLTNNATTTVVFNSELEDTGAIYNNATGVVTVATAGRYFVSATATLNASAATSNTCDAELTLFANGVSAAVLGYMLTSVNATAQTFGLGGSTVLSLGAGGTIDVRARTNHNGTTPVSSVSPGARLSVFRVSP